MTTDLIISDLRYVMETNQELDILNFYRGFPITSRARVEQIDRDVVRLRVEPPGSVCLQDQSETILLSRGLPEAVRAQVRAFDLRSGALALADFVYVGARFGERMIARVQPEEALPVKIAYDDQTAQGTLLDVSLSGVGVLLPGAAPERGAEIQLTLALPEGAVTLPGKVLNRDANYGSSGAVRLSIGFTRNAQEVAVVMRYIRDRRVEILDEVERMYRASVQAE